MKITKLYEKNGKSYFEDIDCGHESLAPLGAYSAKYPVTGIYFRDTKANKKFDWHNAPRNQYIIYLDGQIEVETSGGEKRVFGPGDVLLATDVTGNGHVSSSLSDGRCVIVTCD